MVPNLKTSTVWGSLPGTIDEQAFVVADRDGWFDGANDNASGVAAMAVLAEYFAKMTPAQRRRTITFLGTTGHHNTGANSGSYFAEHPEIFAKAALIINCEHMGAKATGHFNLRLVDTRVIQLVCQRQDARQHRGQRARRVRRAHGPRIGRAARWGNRPVLSVRAVGPGDERRVRLAL